MRYTGFGWRLVGLGLGFGGSFLVVEGLYEVQSLQITTPFVKPVLKSSASGSESEDAKLKVSPFGMAWAYTNNSSKHNRSCNCEKHHTNIWYHVQKKNRKSDIITTILGQA